MTNLNNLCTSLELSKRLKELGVKQDSVFQWRKNALAEPYIIQTPPEGLEEMRTSGTLEYAISAYTAGELGEMLKNSGWALPTYSRNYVGEEWGSGIHRGATEADARTNLLIHLIETKIIILVRA